MVNTFGLIPAMIKHSKFILSLSVLLLGAAAFHAPAKAEIFYWEDAQTHMSFTYPDRWHVRHNQRPDDIYTVGAPGQNNHANCRLRVREDKRFAVFPEYLSSQVARINYNRNFWEEYLGEYDNVEIHTVYPDAGMGRGFGSYAEASYTTALGPKMDKRALMFVSLYNNKAYIVECSAQAQSYHVWHNSFLSLVKSVDFRKEIHQAKNGFYRNYYGESIRIRGPRDIDVSVY